MKKPKPATVAQTHESQITQRILERIAKDEKEYSLTIERARALKAAVQAISLDLHVETRFGRHGVEIILKRKRQSDLTKWELFCEDTFEDVESEIISAAAHAVVVGRFKKHG